MFLLNLWFKKTKQLLLHFHPIAADECGFNSSVLSQNIKVDLSKTFSFTGSCSRSQVLFKQHFPGFSLLSTIKEKKPYKPVKNKLLIFRICNVWLRKKTRIKLTLHWNHQSFACLCKMRIQTMITSDKNWYFPFCSHRAVSDRSWPRPGASSCYDI